MSNSPYCHQALDLYDGAVPLGVERQRRPHVDIYLPPAELNTGYSMLAFPGGAYSFLSPKSGARYGEWFSSRGIAVIVVSFRTGPEGTDGERLCCDALSAVRIVERNAVKWNLDVNKIGVIGTSAGGHLAGVLSTGSISQIIENKIADTDIDLNWRPEFAVYCYAVLSLLGANAHRETRENFLRDRALIPRFQYQCSPISQVKPGMCRSFIWHTQEDTEVPASNSFDFYKSLISCGNEAELHVYQKGPHALGLAQQLVDVDAFKWPSDCLRWIKDQPVVEQSTI